MKHAAANARSASISARAASTTRDVTSSRSRVRVPFQADHLAPAGYQEKTDRELPIIRLMPRSG